MTINIVSDDKGGYTVDIWIKGFLYVDRISKESLWNQYIVPKKLHITGDDEEYEMDEFFNECGLIAQQLLIKWLKTNKNYQSKK